MLNGLRKPKKDGRTGVLPPRFMKTCQNTPFYERQGQGALPILLSNRDAFRKLRWVKKMGVSLFSPIFYFQGLSGGNS